jgi:hypothetical protein
MFVSLTHSVIPQAYSEPPAPSWRYQPPSSGTSSSADTRSPEQKEDADKYFDSIAGSADPLDGPQRFIRGGGSRVYKRDEDFPSLALDEVVVGHFSTWNSYISSSKHSIYTVVNLHIDRVVSSKSGLLYGGPEVPVYITGGTIVLPKSGKVYSYWIRSRDEFPLEPNIEYLIFLDRGNPASFYQYVKAWQIDSGVLRPVTERDRYAVSLKRSTHNGMTMESAIEELRSH